MPKSSAKLLFLFSPQLQEFQEIFIVLPKLYVCVCVCVCVLKQCRNAKRTTIYQHNELAMNE